MPPIPKYSYFFFSSLSASCTHVSALLHALSALDSRHAFTPPCTAVDDASDEENLTPCTSLPCRWKAPTKRKESTLPMSEAKFVKHDFSKPVKRKIQSLEEFDPRPECYRGSASSRLPQLLNQLKGEQLCISLLLDPQYQVGQSTVPSSHNIADTPQLQETVAAFKKSLELTCDEAREIERNTRDQRNSPLWFSVRRHRITASFFGSVLSRKPTYHTSRQSSIAYYTAKTVFFTCHDLRDWKGRVCYERVCELSAQAWTFRSLGDCIWGDN